MMLDGFWIRRRSNFNIAIGCRDVNCFKGSTRHSTANAVGAPPTLARSRPHHQLRYHGGGSSTAQHASTSRCGNPHVNTGPQGTECSCGPAPPNAVHMNFGSSRRALNRCCHWARAQCMRACCAGISCHHPLCNSVTRAAVDCRRWRIGEALVAVPCDVHAHTGLVPPLLVLVTPPL